MSKVDIKEFLNMRICDIENCEDTQTWNEFITETEKEFGLKHIEIKSFDHFNWYINFLDELWYK